MYRDSGPVPAIPERMKSRAHRPEQGINHARMICRKTPHMKMNLYIKPSNKENTLISMLISHLIN
jgi:hypothetical protein